MFSPFSGVDSINCFQCNSMVDLDCPYIQPNQTSSIYYKPCIGDFKGRQPFCRKIEQKSKSRWNNSIILNWLHGASRAIHHIKEYFALKVHIKYAGLIDNFRTTYFTISRRSIPYFNYTYLLKLEKKTFLFIKLNFSLLRKSKCTYKSHRPLI